MQQMQWFINVPMRCSHIAILKIKRSSFRFILTGISRSEAINLKTNIDLNENSWTL